MRDRIPRDILVPLGIMGVIGGVLSAINLTVGLIVLAVWLLVTLVIFIKFGF